MPKIILKESIKGYTYDQDKTVDPLSTAQRAVDGLSHMYDLSHVRLERRADAVNGTYSYSSLSDQLQASGKGLTNEQAQASASMEFAERYSWLHFDYSHYDGYQIETFEKIKKGPVPTVDESYFLENYVDLKEREKLTSEIKGIPLKWIKAYSLTGEREFYYPINWHNMVIGSNGLAAGNTLEEAIIQALCEVLERENLFRFFAERRVAKDLDQSSIKNELVREVLENARRKGIEFKIKDISFDFRATTFIIQGISKNDKGTLAYNGVGQGTATDPEKALIRSLAEYFESYSLTKSKEKEIKEKLGDDVGKYLDQFPKRHMGFHAFYNPEMLDQSAGIVKFSELSGYARKDIKQEIEELVKSLKYNVTVIDKTHPGLKIPAVRLFVPGMRNMINCEINSPDIALAEIHFEAKNYDLAQKYFERSMAGNREIRKMTSGVSVRKIFEKDYQQNMVRMMLTKKSALDIVRDYNQVTAAIKEKEAAE